MIHASWFPWWKWPRRRGAVGQHRLVRSQRPFLEELETRRLPSATNPFSSAIAIALNNVQPQAGVISPTPTIYSFTVTDAGRLTAEVAPTGGATRLSLLSSDGSVLMQSDGQSPSNPNDLIDLHLTGTSAGTTYYLEVQGLDTRTSSYVLMTSYTTTIAPYQPLPVGTFPWGIATGDFNGDGKVDVAVANQNSIGNLSIYLGQGDGTFSPPRHFTIGPGVNSLIAGDFNGDGKLDLATANFYNSTVSVLMGNGDGTFGPDVEYPVGVTASAVTAGDFNHDGKLDLAVADYGSNSAFVLLNNGDGTFGAPTQYAVGANPYAIVAGDFNHDGNLDLAVPNYNSDNVSILLGNGDGTFTAGTTVAVGHQPYAVVTGDFNGDGQLDLAVANYGSSNLSILYGDGAGGFAPQVTLATGAGPVALVAADFNGDGRLDLAAGCQNTGTLCVLLGRGDGTFQSQTPAALGSAFSTLAAADFNQDGTMDLAFTDMARNTAQVLLGKGDGTFQTQPPQSPVMRVTQVVAADFNGDGHLDLATVDYSSVNDVTIFLGQQDGTFRFGGKYSAGSDAIALSVGDVNHDGIPDLITTNYSSNNISVLLGNGDGTFRDPIFYPTGTVPTNLVVGDFNGDGNLDVATVDSGSNQVSILFGDGMGGFAPPVNYSVGVNPTGIIAADLTGNGHLDLAVTDAASNDVSILLNNGDGTFTLGPQLQPGLQPQGLAAGDFNGDGHLDLAVANAGSNSVSVFLGDGHGNFASPVTLAVAGSPSQVLVGDFNRDHKLDLAALDQTTNAVTVYEGLGDGTFQQIQQVPIGQGPIGGVLGDFTGNGILDLVTANSQSGDVSVLIGGGDGTFRPALRTAIATGPNSIAAIDVNGTGTTDLVTANPSTGNLEVSASNGDGTFQNPLTIHVGGEPVAVAVGDFNRDNRPGIAVADYQGNTVTILTGIGDGTFRVEQSIVVGNHPDALVTGEFDNDGSTELAVANYGSGTVTILDGSQDGTFKIDQVIAVGQGPVALSLGDVNGDGTVDLIVANSLSRSLTILESNGDGTFRLARTIALGTTPSAVVTGDFNGDGHLDVAIADQADNAVYVLLGNGDGTFQAPVRFAAGTGPVSMVAADFNGSGHLDLATVNNNSNDVTILWGNGDGTFQAPSSFPVGSYPNALIVADLNNDGHPDVVTANGLGQPISVLLGLDKQTFDNPDLGAHPIRSIPLVGDLNGNGQPDVAILAADGKILVRFADPNVPGSFEPPVVVNPDPAYSARDLTLVTVNGKQEMAALDARTGTISFYTFAGDSKFVRTQGPVVSATDLMVRIVAGDLTGDGRQDLVVASSGSSHSSIRVYLQQPDGTFVLAGPRVHVGVSISDVALVNLSGGPGPDVVVTDQFSGRVYVLLNTPTAPFTTQRVFRTGTGLYDVTQVENQAQIKSGEAPVALVAGAFTGAATDLVVLNSGSDQFNLLAGDGRGGLFDPVTALTNRTGWDAGAIASGDFNGDGILDLAILDRSSAQVLIYLGDGKGGFVPQYARGPAGEPLGLAAGNAPDSLAVADLSGEGHLDLLIGNAYGDVLALDGNGDGTFEPYHRLDRHVALAVIDQNNSGQPQFAFANKAVDSVTYQSDASGPAFQQGRLDGVLSPNAVTFADLNGDGIPDLIVANGGGNDVLVYPGLSNGQFGPAQRFFVGTDPVGITVSDLNGDGIPDLVVANRGSNDVSVLYGEGRGAGWTLKAGPRLRAGVGPTATVVQDVNGNGIPDVFVANGGSNDVYLLPGTGQGFFDDAHPVIFQTGSDPVQLFVGHFGGGPGLDLVTVNAGSNDLTFFANFGPGQSLSTGGVNPVAAIAGDFNNSGSSSLIVANGDGRFALLLASANGPEVTNVVTIPGLVNVSDLALGSVNNGEVEVFATTEGGEAAIPLAFALDINPILPASDSSTAVASFRVGELPPELARPPVTEFSSLAGSQLEIVATLTLGSNNTILVADASQAVAAERWIENGETEDPDGVRVAEGSEPPTADNMSAVNRNGFITGATETPIQQHLNRSGNAEGFPALVPFPSPLELFDGSDKALFPPRWQQIIEEVYHGFVGEGGTGSGVAPVTGYLAPVPCLPALPATTQLPRKDEVGAVPGHDELQAEPTLWTLGVDHIRDAAICLISAFIAPASPKRQGHEAPIVPSTTKRKPKGKSQHGS